MSAALQCSIEASGRSVSDLNVIYFTFQSLSLSLSMSYIACRKCCECHLPFSADVHLFILVFFTRLEKRLTSRNSKIAPGINQVMVYSDAAKVLTPL
jgi:hypothetical protein